MGLEILLGTEPCVIDYTGNVPMKSGGYQKVMRQRGDYDSIYLVTYYHVLLRQEKQDTMDWKSQQSLTRAMK